MNALWSIVRKLLFGSTPTVMHRWRIGLLNLFGAKASYSAQIAPSVVVLAPRNLRLGPGARIMPHVIINCAAPVTIEGGALISQYAHLCTATRDHEQNGLPRVAQPITIGQGAWVAADAYVGPGVNIGDRAVIGARSDVHNDLPADMIAYGSPAAPVRPRVVRAS